MFFFLSSHIASLRNKVLTSTTGEVHEGLISILFLQMSNTILQMKFQTDSVIQNTDDHVDLEHLFFYLITSGSIFQLGWNMF